MESRFIRGIRFSTQIYKFCLDKTTPPTSSTKQAPLVLEDGHRCTRDRGRGTGAKGGGPRGRSVCGVPEGSVPRWRAPLHPSHLYARTAIPSGAPTDLQPRRQDHFPAFWSWPDATKKAAALEELLQIKTMRIVLLFGINTPNYKTFSGSSCNSKFCIGFNSSQVDTLIERIRICANRERRITAYTTISNYGETVCPRDIILGSNGNRNAFSIPGSNMNMKFCSARRNG